MPNGQNPSQVADETQRRLGQKVYTTPENTKDPYKGDNSQGSPDQKGNEVDPRQNPLAFFYQHRSRLRGMNEEDAVKFVDRIFKRFALPKYEKINPQGLDQTKIDELRLQFAARMFNIPYQPVEMEGKAPDLPLETRAKEAGKKTGKELEAAAKGGVAGYIGGVKTIPELEAKLAKYLGATKMASKLESAAGFLGKAEGKLYGKSKSLSPDRPIPEISAAAGHAIPATALSTAVGAGLPNLGGAAGEIVSGAGRGAAEGSTFEATRPGGDPKSGAVWGGLLGAAFPFLKATFGLGRKAFTSKAAEAAEEAKAGTSATEAVPKTTAESPKGAESKSLGDIANKAAKDKFGKAFKDLTSTEKAQMPSIMKEEIAKQRAQQAATKKAEQAAAKAGREAEAEAKRVEKAKAATAKTEKQAARKSVVPTPTPAAKQAVAAQAAEENPAIAKTMGDIKPPAERRTNVRTESIEGPDFYRTALMNELRKKAAAGDKLAAEQLADMKAHPFEKAGEEFDIAKAKAKGEKTLTKEEAEAASAKRAEGRIQKLGPEETGKKVRAKEGVPASPAQQATDRERIAAKRAEAKSQEFGAALEKHAQQMAGRYTSESLANIDITQVEDAARELEGGSLVMSGMKKLVRQKKMTEELYREHLIDWMKIQFAALPKAFD